MAICTAALNILLNLVFIPVYGYKWAAYTTVISYVFMIGILYYWDREVINGMSNRFRDLTKVLLMFAFQYAVYLVLENTFDLIITSRIAIGIIFVVVFFLLVRKFKDVVLFLVFIFKESN